MSAKYFQEQWSAIAAGYRVAIIAIASASPASTAVVPRMVRAVDSQPIDAMPRPPRPAASRDLHAHSGEGN